MTSGATNALVELFARLNARRLRLLLHLVVRIFKRREKCQNVSSIADVQLDARHRGVVAIGPRVIQPLCDLCRAKTRGDSSELRRRANSDSSGAGTMASDAVQLLHEEMAALNLLRYRDVGTAIDRVVMCKD